MSVVSRLPLVAATLGVLINAALVLPALSISGGDKDKTDKDRLQGAWRVIALEQNGKPAPEKEYRAAKLYFVGDQLYATTEDGGGNGTFTLAPSKQPSHIDLTTKPANKTVPGIYRLDGDKLLLCFPEGSKTTRPTEFKSDEKHGVLMVLERSNEKIDVAKLEALVDQGRNNAQRAQSQNNLKQIVLAFHSYHDAHRHLPPQAICDKDGKPLLSWRVAILEYLEQANLKQQFRLEEAWDSPHNIKFLDKIPAIYEPVGGEKVKPGYTFYQVFTGPNTLYPEPKSTPKFTDIKDGTSNTLLVVEAGAAVPWTKPEDIVYDPKAKELPKLGGMSPTGFNAAWCDGTVSFLKRDLDPNILRAIITPKGGEVVTLDRDMK